MKRWIHATYQPNTLDNGFFFTFGNHGIFLRSNKKNLTAEVIRDVINAVCDIKGVDSERRKIFLYDEDTLKDFRKRISKAQLQHRFTDSIDFYVINGDNFSVSYPSDEFEEEITVVDGK